MKTNSRTVTTILAIAFIFALASSPIGARGEVEAAVSPLPTTSMAQDACGLDVLPVQALVTITNNRSSELVRLTSNGLPDAVIARRPGAMGKIETELVSLALQGNSSLMGRIEMRAGRQYNLLRSLGEIPRSAVGDRQVYDSFFDMTYVIELPDQPRNSILTFSHLLTLRREATHLTFGIDYVTHADQECNFGTCVNNPGHVCWEIFINGVKQGCGGT